MSALNPSLAALSFWMRPSVGRSWVAQVTRYSQRRRPRYCRDEGEIAFRALLNRDWVTLDLPRHDPPFGP